jgi:hypothetical protein
MSTCDVAVIREQGQTFAVAVVQDNVIGNPIERSKALQAWSLHLGCRVALMGAHRHQTFGPPDIIRWLQGVHPGRLPWRRITI